MKKQEEKRMKGLVEQISERGKTYPNDNFTKKNLVEILDMLQDSESKVRTEKIKKRKEDEKWLKDKSRELGEPIPWILAYFAHTQQTCYHTDLLKTYQEWFKPIKPHIINKEYSQEETVDYLKQLYLKENEE